MKFSYFDLYYVCSLLLLRACCSNSYRTTMNLWLWHGYKRETCHSRFIIGQCTVFHPWGKIGNCLIYYSPPRGVLVNWSIYHFPLQFTISPHGLRFIVFPLQFTIFPQIYYFPLLRWTGPYLNLNTNIEELTENTELDKFWLTDELNLEEKAF